MPRWAGLERVRADSVPAAASLAFLVAVQVAAPAGLTGGGEGGGAGGGAARTSLAQTQGPAGSQREATAGDASRPGPARRQQRGPGQAARWSRGDDPA